MKVLAGGVVHTMAAAGPVEAVAFDAGRIVATGRRADILAQAGPGAEILELAGRAVVPGFVDPHHHLAYAAVLGGAFPCGPSIAPTVAALRERLALHAATLPAGECLVGFGYDERRMDRRPTVRDLDDACPGRPVVLVQYSCHEALANTLALEAAG